MRSPGGWLLLGLSILGPLRSMVGATSEGHPSNFATLGKGSPDDGPLPSHQRRSDLDQKCAREMQACSDKSARLAGQWQDLEEERKRLEHRLDFFTQILTNQKCGSRKALFDAWHQAHRARRTIDESAADDGDAPKTPSAAAPTDSVPTLTSAASIPPSDTATAKSAGPTSTNSTYTSTDVEWCAKEKNCWEDNRQRERELAMRAQDISHKQARINQVTDEIHACAHMIPGPVAPMGGATPNPPLQRRAPWTPAWGTLGAMFQSWASGCQTKLVKLDSAEKRLSGALERARTAFAARMAEPGMPASAAMASSSSKASAAPSPASITSAKQNRVKVVVRDLGEGDFPFKEEAKWNAFVECSGNVQKKHESIKDKFQQIDVLQKQLRFHEAPFGRKREILPSDQELAARELRPEDFGLSASWESEYDLKPALQERTPKKNNAYTKTLERAGQVIEFWRDLYSDGFSENLEKYADLSDAIWELVDHDQNKASSLLASATRAPLAAATAAGQITPTAIALENGLLPTTLQTRTRSGSIEGDSTDALAPDVTPAP